MSFIEYDVVPLHEGILQGEMWRRRPGEPFGHLPVAGERVRYAARHTAWDDERKRWRHGEIDRQGEWSEPMRVAFIEPLDDDRFRVDELDDFRVELVDAIGGRWTPDTLRSIFEPIVEDGALW